MAAGFAPGSLNRETSEYRVRDLDAHSWVEVYFNGIGWVSFDPTPAAAPAEAQQTDLVAKPQGRPTREAGPGVVAPEAGGGTSSAPLPDRDSSTSPWLRGKCN